jgi:hypothetical protein
MLTSGEEAYAAYITAVEQREVAASITQAMWKHLMLDEQRVWEEVAALLALHQHGLHALHRRSAWCALCNLDLPTDAVRCPKHPAGDVCIIFGEEPPDATN